MNSDDLTRAQIHQMGEVVARMNGYLNRLTERMVQRDFPTDDRLFRAVVEASDKIHTLNVMLHYMGVDGVGYAPRKTK